jgi:hypothetical protein
MVAHFIPYVSPETGKMQTRAEFMYSVPLPGFKLGRAQLAEPWLANPFITKTTKYLEGIQRASEVAVPESIEQVCQALFLVIMS